MNESSQPYSGVRRLSAFAVATCLLAMCSVANSADAPPHGAPQPNSLGRRALPAGKLPDDHRLGPLQNFDGYFPFTPPATREAWERRAEQVRRQLLVALGLWPLPTRTPLNAVVHGRVERDEYTVDKVFFESFPGHYVTGSLYRPKGKKGPLPVVLCPHGHWKGGRLGDQGLDNARKQIVEGAERFESGGRHPLEARCVQLARMGCVAFFYDMEGYADSQQIPESVAHRYSKQRPDLDGPTDWGFFSVQAELHLQTIMGLQTWNSIRAIDFVTSLPYVDAKRIAVTGASGGGTQTFILSAVDPRVAFACPAVMVSTAMQGGCTCENCCYLRVGTGNIEIAALIAPRPLGMLAADDWTKELPTKGFPELQRIYRLLGVPDRVMMKPLLQFPHNYNFVSREIMYHWMNKELKLGLPEPIIEEDFRPLSVDEASVWNAEHPRPTGGPEHERELLRWMTADAEQQIHALIPHDLKTIIGGAWQAMIGRGLPPPGNVSFTIERREERDAGYSESVGLIRYAAEKEELPAVLLTPKNCNNQVAVWIDGAGKAGLYTSGGLKPAVEKLLAGGVAVLGVDLLDQGEFTADGKPLKKARRVSDPPNSRDAACFTYGYNRTVFAERVSDVLSALAAAKELPASPVGANRPPRQVLLVGVDGGGAWVAAAAALAPEATSAAAIDTQGFRFAEVRSIDDPDFMPGGAKYLDVPGLLALCSPLHLWVAGERDNPPPLVKSVYETLGKSQRLTISEARAEDRPLEAATWILRTAEKSE